jgi:hypothetical protein
MGQFVGLDVSVAETSICIVDDHGKIARERKVPTEPEAIIEALNGSGQLPEHSCARALGGNRRACPSARRAREGGRAGRMRSWSVDLSGGMQPESAERR